MLPTLDLIFGVLRNGRNSADSFIIITHFYNKVKYYQPLTYSDIILLWKIQTSLRRTSNTTL